jgi:hypothetical protein
MTASTGTTRVTLLVNIPIPLIAMWTRYQLRNFLISQYPPPNTARTGSPAPMIGPGTGLPASAGSTDAAVTASTANAKGAMRFNFGIAFPCQIYGMQSRYLRWRTLRTTQYPPARTARTGSPAPMIGPGTGVGPASAGSIDAMTTASTGVMTVSLVANISVPHLTNLQFRVVLVRRRSH